MNKTLSAFKYAAILVALWILFDDDLSVKTRASALLALIVYHLHSSETIAAERHAQIIERMNKLEDRSPYSPARFESGK